MKSEYRRGLKKSLPIETRVAAIAEVAGARQNPFARLRAVEYADRMDGIAPEKAPDLSNSLDSSVRPMFNLEGGAHITVNVVKPPLLFPKTVDITADK